jgi:protein-tyrosine-phosphatase
MGVILFVCTANICRSPMAVGLLRKRFSERGLDSRYQVLSAGVQAENGRKASRHAIIVMAQRWIDITDHLSHTITGDDMARADLILVMSEEQAKTIRQAWPQYGWKVHRLSEMADKRQDVKDPYGGSLEKYEACADTMARYIDDGLERILELA